MLSNNPDVWAEGEEMINWRLAVPAVIAAAAVAACMTYFVSPAPQRIEADQMPPTVPRATGRQDTVIERSNANH